MLLINSVAFDWSYRQTDWQRRIESHRSRWRQLLCCRWQFL